MLALLVSVVSGAGMTNATELAGDSDSGSLYSWEAIEAKGVLVGRKKWYLK